MGLFPGASSAAGGPAGSRRRLGHRLFRNGAEPLELADDSVKTELSGLKVVEDDRVREHTRQLQARLPELVGYLRDDRDPGDCPLGGSFIPEFQQALQQARQLKV